MNNIKSTLESIILNATKAKSCLLSNNNTAESTDYFVGLLMDIIDEAAEVLVNQEMQTTRANTAISANQSSSKNDSKIELLEHKLLNYLSTAEENCALESEILRAFSDYSEDDIVMTLNDLNSKGELNCTISDGEKDCEWWLD